MKKPELLAPAGSLSKLKTAFQYGADAVYFGGQQFSLRAAAQNLNEQEIAEGANIAHELGKKLYCTVNIMPKNSQLEPLPAYLKMLERNGVDAVLVSDLGVFDLVQQHTQLPIHVSTQANTVNYAACNMWHRMGAERVVLARECTLQEIREIRAHIPPELELEVFVHGAMCVSYSGRCLLSNFLTGRSGNQGACAQPCRWKYHLMEEKRPGEFFPVEEDEHGTFIMNSKDLCMIEHIPELVEAGVSSLKIEGRMKTEYYVATVVNAYRRAIDLYAADPAHYSLPRELYDEVRKVSHRDYYTGFFYGDARAAGQVYETSMYIRDYDVVAVVEGYDESTGLALCEQRNRFWKGDTLELLSWKDGSHSFTADELYDGEGTPLEVCPHPAMKLKMKIPYPVEAGMFLRKAAEPEKQSKEKT